VNDDRIECPQCEGDAQELGSLGATPHYRCRACGWTFAGPDEGRYVSDVIRTSGGTFYRNKRGRCEDAPCCGCCTI
jgi:transposase-like protein